MHLRIIHKDKNGFGCQLQCSRFGRKLIQDFTRLPNKEYKLSCRYLSGGIYLILDFTTYAVQVILLFGNKSLFEKPVELVSKRSKATFDDSHHDG